MQDDEQSTFLRRQPLFPVTRVRLAPCRLARRLTGGVLAAVLTLATGACDTFEGIFSEKKEFEEVHSRGMDEPKKSKEEEQKALREPRARYCPGVGVIKDAATVTKFLPGAGRSEKDLLYYGEITDARVSCVHDLRRYAVPQAVLAGLSDDESLPPVVGYMKLEMKVTMRMRTGSSAPIGRHTLRYFVSITDDERRNVLNKEVFDLTVNLPRNPLRLTLTDKPIELQIPLRQGQSGKEYEIFVGFQLSGVDLEYNRSGAPSFK